MVGGIVVVGGSVGHGGKVVAIGSHGCKGSGVPAVDALVVRITAADVSATGAMVLLAATSAGTVVCAPSAVGSTLDAGAMVATAVGSVATTVACSRPSVAAATVVMATSGAGVDGLAVDSCAIAIVSFGPSGWRSAPSRTFV